ncbi:MAG: flagellar hook-associated protein FlgL [Thermoleophilia bacterium]|nr:flagellar hook-associated protein FlgL [Thermoleophilia bacterium]
MAVRVTQNAMTNQFQADISKIYAKMAKSQQQVSDGRAITKPSDDPIGAGRVMTFDAQIQESQQNQKSVSESIGFMDTADTALDTVVTALQGIQDLTRKAASGTHNLADMQSIAAEILQLKDVVRDGLNAQHGSAFVFAGTGGTQPYPAGANAYAGTNNPLMRLVAPGQTVAINVSGETVLGVAPNNTLDDIDALVLDVQAGNHQAVHNRIAQMDTDINRALDVRTQMGATVKRLESLKERLSGVEERLTDARSQIANVDAAEAYMNFTQQQTMYQAALAAGTRIMQTSILDFI